eukprot:2993066-Ditylum_brightwellii.AAC.1
MDSQGSYMCSQGSQRSWKQQRPVVDRKNINGMKYMQWQENTSNSTKCVQRQEKKTANDTECMQ